MFNFFREKRIKKYTENALTYVSENYRLPLQVSDDDSFDEPIIKYSSRDKPSQIDSFNSEEIARLFSKYSNLDDFNEVLLSLTLELNVSQTFADKLLYYIRKKSLRNSEVYKAAQIDKRLFSKIISNQNYKPSKDTAIALAFALKLTLNEADDFLSYAGYTLSHSDKRDIIIEFFFIERIYNLTDINDVLYRLNMKLIGRF